jgi:FkbM family methyltransferase
MLSLVALSCFTLKLTALTIYTAGPHNHGIGLNNTDIHSNGEAKAAQTFIQPGAIVFDIGANKGDWSTYALTLAPNISLYIFEPIPSVFKILENNIRSPHAKFFNIAVAEHNTTKTFFYYDQNIRCSEFSSLHRRSADIEKALNISPLPITVTTKNLDSICQEEGISHIDFLKIDTEGAEWEIIRGAKGLLQKKAVAVLQFEYGGNYQDAKTTLEQVYTFLTQHDYSVFRIIPDGLLYIAEWDPALENYQYSNHLAVSNSRLKLVFKNS